jgi:pyruvate dehydrogenase E1 component alpha subunit
MTHRMAGHYVGDAQHYRSKEELAAVKEKCPIERMRRHLIERGVKQGELDAIGEEATQEVLQAVARARAAPPPDPAGVFDYVYGAASLAAPSGTIP